MAPGSGGTARPGTHLAVSHWEPPFTVARGADHLPAGREAAFPRIATPAAFLRVRPAGRPRAGRRARLLPRLPELRWPHRPVRLPVAADRERVTPRAAEGGNARRERGRPPRRPRPARRPRRGGGPVWSTAGTRCGATSAAPAFPTATSGGSSTTPVRRTSSASTTTSRASGTSTTGSTATRRDDAAERYRDGRRQFRHPRGRAFRHGRGAAGAVAPQRDPPPRRRRGRRRDRPAVTPRTGRAAGPPRFPPASRKDDMTVTTKARRAAVMVSALAAAGCGTGSTTGAGSGSLSPGGQRPAGVSRSGPRPGLQDGRPPAGVG